jgi:hypothetical protein
MRLVQLEGPQGRRVAIVEEPQLRFLEGCTTVYELAGDCLREGVLLRNAIEKRKTGDLLEYDTIYDGKSDWRL